MPQIASISESNFNRQAPARERRLLDQLDVASSAQRLHIVAELRLQRRQRVAQRLLPGPSQFIQLRRASVVGPLHAVDLLLQCISLLLQFLDALLQAAVLVNPGSFLALRVQDGFDTRRVLGQLLEFRMEVVVVVRGYFLGGLLQSPSFALQDVEGGDGLLRRVLELLRFLFFVLESFHGSRRGILRGVAPVGTSTRESSTPSS